MENVIKLKAYDKRTKCITELLGFKYVGKTNIQLFYLDEDGCSTTCTTELEYIEILRYTGLKDKNGKEIYESDIITDGVFNYIIKWIDFGFCKVKTGVFDRYKTMLYGIENYTMIGSIYDNPELLQEVDK